MIFGKYSPAIGRIAASAALCLPFVLFSWVMLSNGKPVRGSLNAVSLYIVFASVNVLFFLMLFSRKTYRYRKIFFVAYALFFAVSFMTNLIDIRGSVAITEGRSISGETPFCHIAITMMLIPAAINQTIIFPGSLLKGWTSVASMLVIWIGAVIVLGRAWCSWACFYGGFDEGFSSITKRTRLDIPRKWLLMPFAVLIAVALLSAATLSPVYCAWLCPFKAVTEYAEIVSLKTLIAAVIFYTLFAVLVIVLPLLTRKRTQCALFCPFGALQSLANKINIFEVRIDPDACRKCGKCVKICPTMSIDEQSVSAGKTLLSCTKCGRCVDNCPSGAVYYHIKGTPLSIRRNAARVLFLYAVFLFAVTIGGPSMTKGLYRLLNLAVNGSLW
jgi:polyferredoxin